MIDALIFSPLKRVVVIDTEGHVKGIISDVDVLSQMQEEVRPGLLGTLAGWARSKPGRLPTATLQTSHGKARIAADLMNRDVATVNEMTSVQATHRAHDDDAPLIHHCGLSWSLYHLQ